ncbi:pyrophosphate--fructose 6-phosphate 1-phosphotransferase subunit beta [Tanacetum coccineum]
MERVSSGVVLVDLWWWCSVDVVTWGWRWREVDGGAMMLMESFEDGGDGCDVGWRWAAGDSPERRWATPEKQGRRGSSIGSVAAGTSEVTILFSFGLGRESPRRPLQLEGRHKLVKYTYLIAISLKVRGSLPEASLKIGVVLSGGQAPGGHNVISGIFDYLQKRTKDSTMYGFRGGPVGVM